MWIFMVSSLIAGARVRIAWAILVLFSSGCRLLPPPSDAVMAQAFYQNEKDFEQLRQLIMEDSSVGIVLAVFQDRTDPSIEEASRRGLSQARLEKYRRLLQRLGLRGVGTGGDAVMFQASATGLYLLKGTSKGYVYTEGNLPQLKEAQGYYKPLQAHWYLYCYKN
jgi:hypothetical protein